MDLQTKLGFGLHRGFYSGLYYEHQVLIGKNLIENYGKYGFLLEKKGIHSYSLATVVGEVIGYHFSNEICFGNRMPICEVRFPNPHDVLFPSSEYSLDDRKKIALLQEKKLDHSYVIKSIEDVFENVHLKHEFERICRSMDYHYTS